MNKQYIKYNIGDYDACGVVVEKYFITAAHVFNYGDFIFKHGDRTIKLSKDDAIYFSANAKTPLDIKGYDIAIFSLDGIESPLRMSKAKVNKGDTLKSISYHHVGSSNECFEEIECTATVEKIEGNYFLCSMEKTLQEGSSGSPIFDSKGNICGILCAGNEENAQCAFTSSVSIDIFVFQYFKQELCNKIDIGELLQQTQHKLMSIAIEYLRLTSFSIAPSEEDMIKYAPLNVREIFICLTQMEISESLLHDCVMQIDSTGIYYDEIYSAISRADYKRFKEVLQSKHCTLNKVSLTLQNYLACGLSFKDTQTEYVNFIQDTSANDSIILNWMISTGFFSQDEIEMINFGESITTKNDEEVNTYSLSQYEILISDMNTINKLYAKQCIRFQQIEGLTRTKQYQELFSNPILQNLNESVGFTNDEYQQILSILSNVDMLDMFKNATYLLGRTIIAKLDDQFKEKEASQCEKNNTIIDNGSTVKASPVVDYRVIFAPQAPKIESENMRKIAMKLAGQIQKGNSITYSTEAYLYTKDISRFCYFFLNKNYASTEEVDFSYPIQWLGGWESLKYFVFNLYGQPRSLPANLAMTVVEAFRFNLQRNNDPVKGKISEKTFKNSKNINSIVSKEDMKRINTILKEFNLLR